MNFLYPKFNTVTHKLQKIEKGISINYPQFSADSNKFDYKIDEGVTVSVIQENLGFNCLWHKVIVIDSNYSNAAFYNKEIYILKSALINVGEKQTFEPICSEENSIDPNAEEIDPTLKDIFIPFVDKRNGLYSVRIQIDYDRIIDSVLFENVLEEVFIEGLNVLLASRGFRSDNETINNLRNTYYTFGFINKDLDLTVTRRCEPLTFTVSIPLNFFNSVPVPAREEIPIVFEADKILKFTNKDFLTKIDKILQIFLSKAGDIQQLTFPNKFIDGFILDFEISSIRRFALALSDLMQIAGVPLKTNSDILTEYEIGLSKDLELVFIKAKILPPNLPSGLDVSFNAAMISQCRLRSEFNSKRIFNYLLNLDLMSENAVGIEILQFLERFVKYPNVSLVDDNIILDGKKITPEQAKQFSISYKEKTENCLKFSDITALADSAVNFSDSIYGLFIQKKNGISFTSQLDSLRKDFESVKAEAKNFSNPENKAVKVQIKDGITEALELIDEQYSINANTLSAVISRLNVKEILFRKLFCLLKGLDPNAAETAQILSELPEELINYYNYLVSIKGLTGLQYIKKLEEGFSIDFKLVCSTNASLSYFIKGISFLTKSLNVGSVIVQQYVSFVNELAAAKKIKNPYQALIKNVILTAEQLTVQFLIEYIKDLLTTSCEDPTLEQYGDSFIDPYSTHTPIQRFNSTENNNQQLVKQNREDAVRYAYPDVVRDLQFGSEVDYTINLIDSLLRDVNCILAPIESVQLLRGKPSDLVRTLVKNIIRSKYSSDPNNLSFLITDNNKLDLFFERLGLTIDREVLIEIEKTITNVVEPATLCKPEVLEARKAILEDKLPRNLGILEDQLRRRTNEARKVLERIKGGDVVFEYSVLCPDVSNSELDAVKDNIIKQYEIYIRNTFSSVLTSFTTEAVNLSKKFSEETALQRKKSDGSTFDTLTFNRFNATLAENLLVIPNFILNENYEINGHFTKIKFLPRGNEVPLEELFKTLVADKKTETEAIICPEGAFSLDQKFSEFLNRQNLLYERVLLDEFFDDDGFRDPKLSEGEETGLAVANIATAGLAGIAYVAYDAYQVGDLSDVKNPNYDLNTELGKFLNSKKYFISITVNWEANINASGPVEALARDDETTGPTAIVDDYIYIRFIYNDSINNRFRILEEIEITKTNVDDVLSTELKKKEFPFLRKESNILETKINIFTKEIFDSLSDTWKNIIQSNFINLYDKWIGKIENYETIARSVILFKESGLFNVQRRLRPDLNLVTNEVYVSSLNYDRSAKSTNIIEKPFFSYKNEYEQKNYCDSIVKSIEISNHINQTATSKDLLTYPSQKLYEEIVSSLYSKTYKFIADNYFKIQYFKEEWTDDFGTDYFFEDTFTDRLKNEDVKFTKNPKYIDLRLKNYSNLTRLDLSQDVRYRNCNIFPHYLNLDYYLKLALDDAKLKLCDTNLDVVPKDVLDEILVNMHARVYVTDALIKAVPYLTLFSREDLLNLFKSKPIVNILRNFLIKECSIFSPSRPDESFISDQNNEYYKYLLEKTKRVYNKYKSSGSLKEIFVDEKDVNKEINYFIKKEIRHFIKFSLEKTIFPTQNVTYYKTFIAEKSIEPSFINSLFTNLFAENAQISKEKFLSSSDSILTYFFEDETKRPRGEIDELTRPVNAFDKRIIKNNFTDSLIEEEFYNIISYFIMANTVDFNRRVIFNGTKKELADILGRTLKATEGEQADVFDRNNRSQEDAIKFINNLAYSPNPVAMILLQPQYSKYVIRFLDAAADASRATLLAVAESQDLNILITRKYQFFLSTASLVGWSLVDQQTRTQLILDAPSDEAALIYKRLDDGKSPLPDAIVSLFPGSGWPLLLGISYLALDSYQEYRYFSRAIEEIKELRGNRPNEDPCLPSAPSTAGDDLTCSPQKQKALKDKINSYEEP